MPTGAYKHFGGYSPPLAPSLEGKLGNGEEEKYSSFLDKHLPFTTQLLLPSFVSPLDFCTLQEQILTVFKL